MLTQSAERAQRNLGLNNIRLGLVHSKDMQDANPRKIRAPLRSMPFTKVHALVLTW
jgi:hypothetical protein